jgi:hypothetical protein
MAPFSKLAAKLLPAKLPHFSNLLTEAEVLANLRQEITNATLKDVAAKYHISAQQLSDILYGRANLSKRALGLLRYRQWRFYEKVGK